MITMYWLDFVLDYLDELTLFHCARLVCKEWRDSCQRLRGKNFVQLGLRREDGALCVLDIHGNMLQECQVPHGVKRRRKKQLVFAEMMGAVAKDGLAKFYMVRQDQAAVFVFKVNHKGQLAYERLIPIKQEDFDLDFPCSIEFLEDRRLLMVGSTNGLVRTMDCLGRTVTTPLELGPGQIPLYIRCLTNRIFVASDKLRPGRDRLDTPGMGSRVSLSNVNSNPLFMGGVTLHERLNAISDSFLTLSDTGRIDIVDIAGDDLVLVDTVASGLCRPFGICEKGGKVTFTTFSSPSGKREIRVLEQHLQGGGGGEEEEEEKQLDDAYITGNLWEVSRNHDFEKYVSLLK